MDEIGALRLSRGPRWQESELCDSVLPSKESNFADNNVYTSGDTGNQLSATSKVSRKVRIPATLNHNLNRTVPVLTSASLSEP